MHTKIRTHFSIPHSNRNVFIRPLTKPFVFCVPFEFFVYILISSRMRWCDYWLLLLSLPLSTYWLLGACQRCRYYYLRYRLWRHRALSFRAFFPSNNLSVLLFYSIFVGGNVSKFSVAWSIFQMCFLGIITIATHTYRQRHSTTTISLT